MLAIETLQTTPCVLLALSGSVDSLTSEQLTLRLNSHLSEATPRMILDLSQVGYVSSAGLRSLLIAVKQARRFGGDVRLAAVNDSVHNVLVMSGFTSILKTFPSVTEAALGFSAD
jgi:anti-sigma B factor antagonist